MSTFGVDMSDNGIPIALSLRNHGETLSLSRRHPQGIIGSQSPTMQAQTDPDSPTRNGGALYLMGGLRWRSYAGMWGTTIRFLKKIPYMRIGFARPCLSCGAWRYTPSMRPCAFCGGVIGERPEKTRAASPFAKEPDKWHGCSCEDFLLPGELM